MPNVDLTVTISVIIALTAIIIPMLTSIIDNTFKLWRYNIEVKQSNQNEEVNYVRSIYEKYLISLGTITSLSEIEIRDVLWSEPYNQAYYHLLMFAPKEISTLMKEIHKLITTGDWKSINSPIEELALLIKPLTEDMKPVSK